jgi:hypothetical protein
MPALRWLALVPAAAFYRGNCNHRGTAFAWKALLQVSMALAVRGAAVAATAIPGFLRLRAPAAWRCAPRSNLQPAAPRRACRS